MKRVKEYIHNNFFLISITFLLVLVVPYCETVLFKIMKENLKRMDFDPRLLLAVNFFIILIVAFLICILIERKEKYDIIPLFFCLFISIIFLFDLVLRPIESFDQIFFLNSLTVSVEGILLVNKISDQYCSSKQSANRSANENDTRKGD